MYHVFTANNESFLQQTMSPWFAVQRASQVTMILLAVTMLFIPYLYQPEEAEAGWFLLATAIIAGIVTIITTHPHHCDSCEHHVDPPQAHWAVHSCGEGSLPNALTRMRLYTSTAASRLMRNEEESSLKNLADGRLFPPRK